MEVTQSALLFQSALFFKANRLEKLKINGLAYICRQCQILHRQGIKFIPENLLTAHNEERAKIAETNLENIVQHQHL